MRKTIICNIPMKEKVELSLYISNDESLIVSDRKVRYPINAFLEMNMYKDDILKIILLAKKDKYGNHYKKNIENFKKEILEINLTIGAEIIFNVIDTEFEEDIIIHEQLMGKIIDELEEDSHILVDMTYGPKDLPIIIFSALSFSEKFLNCKIDNIIYGQANFVNGQVVDTKICDMTPLYYLGMITNTIQCNESKKARKMLKTLLEL